MITRAIRTKVIAFVVLALLTTSYLGAKYAGLHLFSSGYQVTASLSDASGLFVNGEVTYHGVQVGKVESLTASSTGVTAVLHINGSAPSIPTDVTAAVADRSVIGEQYLDLRGGSTGALEDGDRLTVTTLTPDLTSMLRAGRDFTASVPQDDLNTVIDETYDLSQGSAESIRRLVSTSTDFAEAADRNWLTSSSLIKNSTQVLDTQEKSAASIRAYSHDLGVLATTLKSSDSNLRKLIENSPAAAREVSALIDQVGRPLGILMSNLVTPAEIFGTNSAGVEDALVRMPEAVSVGWAINSSRGLNMGLAPTFFSPLPCTNGYGGTAKHQGTDTSSTGFNTDASCTSAPSGGQVRGASAAPKGASATTRIQVAGSLADLLGGSQ
ncbi:MlaD family protein [Nocardioides sp.]|uniref:MlaD family protein n=1 Tax=Nocardioides sp. TaxID=35761 RepID=UPI0026169E2B|nr:MlaD family protein [Nocardioides sp.]